MLLKSVNSGHVLESKNIAPESECSSIAFRFMYFILFCCVFIFYSMGCYMFYVFRYVVLHVLFSPVCCVTCVMFSSMLCCTCYVLQYVVLHVLCSPVCCVASFMFSSVLYVLSSSKLCCMGYVTQNVVCLVMFASLLCCMFKVSVQITWNSTGRMAVWGQARHREMTSENLAS